MGAPQKAMSPRPTPEPPRQNVPLGPVDSRHAVRRHWLRRLRRPRGHRADVVMAIAGLSLAGLGALVSAAPPHVLVTVDRSAYSIAGSRLEATGTGVYTGPGGAIVVTRDGGRVRGAGSTVLNGRPMAGRCTEAPEGDSERCTFTVDGQTVVAVDTRTPYGWRRRYQDGQVVDLIVVGGDVPVPVAVGRR